jgi:hypothetical protein
MRLAVAVGVAVSAWALALGAGAAVKGVVGQPSHVGAVDVVEHDGGAPAGFADMVRADALKEAALFGADGAAISLKIEIDKVHFKNVMKAMLLGDENYVQGQVAVVDAASGQPLGTFKFYVYGDRPNAGQRVLAAIDPTGIVGMTQAMSANDPAKEQVVMAANFAEEALRQTFGEARSRAAHAPPAPGSTAAAPASAPAANLIAASGAAQAAASSNSGLEAEAPSGGAVATGASSAVAPPPASGGAA